MSKRELKRPEVYLPEDVSPEVKEYITSKMFEDIERGYKKGVVAPRKLSMSNELINELLEGTVDLHAHGGSEPIPRMLDEFDIAVEMTKAKIKAVVIKNHYVPSACLAGLVQRHVNEWAGEREMTPVEVFGSVCLNYPVGGLNPAAVRTCAAFPRGKVVYMPTMDYIHHVQFGGLPRGTGHTYGGPEVEGISALDEREELVPEMEEILGIIADNDMVLETSHAGEPDRTILVEEARKAGVKNVMISHVVHPVAKCSIETVKDLIKKGAVYIARGIETVMERPPEGADYQAEIIRTIGPENVVIGSDFGSQLFVPHVEGLRLMIRYFIDYGFSKEEISTMFQGGAKLLGLT